MSIVQEIYNKNINISDVELTTEILKHEKLSSLDLWLLPQEPFNEWRKKYDYPKLLNNIKSIQWRFKDWLSDQKLNDDYLLDGYISSFLEHKSKSKDKKLHLVRVRTREKAYLQVWHKDDEKALYGTENIEYDRILTFISYFDWCEQQGEKIDLINTFHRYNQNTPHEQVYLNLNIPLLKMGSIEVPVNSIGIMLRGKKLEFVNLSGLILKDTILFGDMGNLSLHHCTFDNIKCENLDFSLPDFYYTSIKNIQIRNSNLRQWDLINSVVTGNIFDSKLNGFRIFGGQFIPTFTNSEANDFVVETKGLPHSGDFEKTYRTLSKCSKDSGNEREGKRYKILEKDFIRSKQKRLRKLGMWISKHYWRYGQNPERIICISLIVILSFGILYSFFPCHLGLSYCNTYIENLGESIYYSFLTFVTLSYGTLMPHNFLKIFAIIEAFYGVIAMGFLLAGLTRQNE